jgi:hypothetical protein
MAAKTPKNSPSRKALNIQRNTSDSGKLKEALDEVDISTTSLDKDFLWFYVNQRKQVTARLLPLAPNTHHRRPAVAAYGQVSL